jgi:hypothetical protein
MTDWAVFARAGTELGIGSPPFPCWCNNPKQAGNSDTRERIALMERFIALFGKDKVYCLLSDREFIGEDWFKWLKKNNITKSSTAKPCAWSA